MTAESIDQSLYYEPDLINKLGSMVLPKSVIETSQGSEGLIFSPIDPDLLQPDKGTRAIALAATHIKERFQSISGSMHADERDVRRAQLREDSVRLIFKSFGLLPNSEAINTPFSIAYVKTESAVEDMDRQKLVDLADKFEGHPAIRVFDTLSHIASIKSDDIVFMRRTSLALLDTHSA